MNQFELDKIIEKSFRAEPAFRLPKNFAQNVIFVVNRRNQLKSDLKEYLFLSVVILTLVLVAVGLYYYIDKEFVLRAIDFASGNLVQVIFALFLLNFIFFADRVLLRLLFSRWKLNG